MMWHSAVITSMIIGWSNILKLGESITVIYGGTRRPVQSRLYWITLGINWEMGMGVGRGGVQQPPSPPPTHTHTHTVPLMLFSAVK